MLEKDKGKMNKHQIILNKKNTKKNGNDKKKLISKQIQRKNESIRLQLVNPIKKCSDTDIKKKHQ